MLVLSRKHDEQLVIDVPGLDEPIVVTVVEIRGDKVRLGIVAPREVPVHRREVYEAIQREEIERERDTGDTGRHDLHGDEDNHAA